MNLPSRQVILSVGIFFVNEIWQTRRLQEWKESVKALLDDYPDVSLSAMGFPDNWRTYELWK